MIFDFQGLPKYNQDNMVFQVVIIGAGRIGKALGEVLGKKGARVEFWDKDSEKVASQKDFKQLIPSADFLFLCVPSNATREVCEKVKDVLSLHTTVVSLSKGIESNTLKTIDEVLKEVLSKSQPFAILGGPLMAEDLVKGMKGIGVVAWESEETGKKIVDLFDHTNVSVESSLDVRGVALGGVLKNVYGLALGIADGMEWGSNTKGWFAVKAMREMEEIVKLLGGEEKTVWSPAGLGDLIATGFSPYSRNRKFAEEMVRDGKCDIECEGCTSLPLLMELLGEKIHQFPFLCAIYKILFERKEPDLLFQR